MFKALNEKLTEIDLQKGRTKDRPLFDIIAGAYIGAANAAIIVGNILQHKRSNQNTLTESEIWKDSVEQLDKFWTELSIPTYWLDESMG